MLKKSLLLVFTIITLLIAVLTVNTLRKGSRQLDVPPISPAQIDEAAAAQKLAGAVRFKTISKVEDPDANAEEFAKLRSHLEQSFPHAHAAMKREIIGGASLLYTWPGTDPQAKPIGMIAHQDVVPVAPGTEGDWQAEPFSGAIKDGFVWGRGAWDDKGNLYAMLHAVDLLAQSGFKPRQTVHLIFGHDEEIGGVRGAKAIAAELQSRNVRFDFVIDEGLLITDGILKGIDSPVALIGVAEKGYLSVQLRATTVPGHSSMPPNETAIGLMSRALAELERRQMPAEIGGIAREMFETIAPEMPIINRVLLANLWLTGPIVRTQLEKGPSTNALIRTTTALTLVNAGNKENVLPGQADATVNFRLLPGDSPDAVLEHVKRTIASNAIAATSTPGFSAASGVSATESPSFQLINRTVRELFPGTVVAPGLTLGGTDSRHFQALSDHIYRFSPVRAKAGDLPRFHGTNERISVRNYIELIQFYRRLLQNAAQSNT
jgi:carboxypeptidase PM20D1